MSEKRFIGWRSASVVALLAASVVPVVATASTAGAQDWRGFSVSQLPSAIAGGASEGWALAVTNDLGGNGLDVWNVNHGSRSEALIDLGTSGSRIQTATQAGSEIPFGPDSHGVAFSDIDGDGDDDLLEVTGRNNLNRLFENVNGELVSVDAGGLEDFFGRGREPLFADFDGDGDMDVLITNLDLRSDPVPDEERQLIPSEVYLNNGDGTSWTKAPDPNDVLDEGHVRMVQLTSTGPGQPPIAVTHDVFNLAKDSIAVGTGSGQLRAPATSATQRNIGPIEIREVLVGDFDGDLHPEFVVFGASESGSNGVLPITAYEVTAAGNGRQVTIPVSDDLDNCRSGTSGDFDNDGDLDIIAGCTQVQQGQDRNVMLLNDGNGNFRDAGTGVLPRTGSDTAAGMVTADVNRDGWLDAIVTNGYDFEPGEDDILTNRAGTNAHWLGIDLVGSNPDAMGAQVFVGTDEWQVRENGHAYHRSQDSRTLHFGLGNATSIAPVHVQWPDGSFEVCTVDNIDRVVTLVQGSSRCDGQTRGQMMSALNARPEGSSNNSATCSGRTVTVNLANGDRPTGGNDVILGTSGNDVIDGLGGNDTICGLGGSDTINGGSGKDTISGGKGKDTLNGGNGNDVITGDKGDDRINGGKGNDELYGNNGADRVNGNRGSGDVLRGGNGRDALNGGPGGNDGCSFGGSDTRTACEGGVSGR